MDWRFVGFAVAGYALVWMAALYMSISMHLLGQSIVATDVVALALWFSPFGALLGGIAETIG